MDCFTENDWAELRGKLQSVLDSEVICGRECGCQLAIWHKGELKVDLCAGFTDASRKNAVASDTLFPIYSSGKPLLAAAVLRAVERGLLRVDMPLCEVWQEFGNRGKEAVTVEHALSHRAGLNILPKTDSMAELADWELMCSRMAEMTPRSVPGGKCVYHPVTYAYLAGNPLVKVYGKPLREIMLDEVLRPCGMEDEFFFGISDRELERFAWIDESGLPESEIPSWHVQTMHDPVVQRGCVPSFNAVASARALAKFYAAAAGDLPGVKLLEKETLSMATEKEWRRSDDVLPDGAWYHFGLGFAVNSEFRIFGHGGAAGAEGFYDRKHKIAVAFVKNHLLMEHPVHPVRDRIAEILDIPIRHW